MLRVREEEESTEGRLTTADTRAVRSAQIPAPDVSNYRLVCDGAVEMNEAEKGKN
jgi:hypothetical protein